jgi:hypothetical protein
VPRRVFQRLLPEWLHPERCVEGHYLQRTLFGSIAEWKFRRRRQLAEDGNVEISGRDPCQLPIADVRRASPKQPQSTLLGHSAFAPGMALHAPEPSFKKYRELTGRLANRHLPGLCAATFVPETYPIELKSSMRRPHDICKDLRRRGEPSDLGL